MATVVFLGRGVVTPVKQVETFQLTADDAATTYTMTIGGQTVSITGSGTGVNDTASALQTALEASAHPYFSNIDWTVSTDTVTGTSGVAGVPFTATASDTGGTGTIGAGTVTTAADSKHHAMSAANYIGGVAPTAGDNLVIHPDASNICWDLDLGAGDIASLDVPDGGRRIGLDSAAFATSADGETVDTSVAEYRDTYLEEGFNTIDIGNQYGPTVAATPSPRIKIKNNISGIAPEAYVHGVRGTASEVGLPACRIHLSDASADLTVRSAIGGVGVGVEPGESATIGDLDMFVKDSASKVFLGDGVALTNFEQSGGTTNLSLTGNLTSAKVYGGIVNTRWFSSSWVITTLTITAGTVNVANGGGIGTLNGEGGTVSFQSVLPGASGITTLNPEPGFTLLLLDDSTSIGTLNDATGKHSITWTQG